MTRFGHGHAPWSGADSPNMSASRVIWTWTGYCASCPEEQPLAVLEHGERGLRAWLAGVGPEDRTLSYTCLVCGRVEHVPSTEAEDAEHDAALLRWPDWVEPAPAAAPVLVEAGDVFGLAAAVLIAAPRPGHVSVITLPSQRVSATDVLAVAA